MVINDVVLLDTSTYLCICISTTSYCMFILQGAGISTSAGGKDVMYDYGLHLLT